ESVRRAGRHPGGGRAPRTAAGSGYPAPASAAQERFWFLRERDPGRPTYNMPGVLRLHGDLDEDALEAALRAVLGRHPVLLARFTERPDGLVWVPGTPEEFELPRLDLRGAVAEFGTEVFTSLAEDEAGVVADLRRELPFRALLARLGPRDWSLFVVVDHIVCDGWSLSVFLADLADAYNRTHHRSPANGDGRSPAGGDGRPPATGDGRFPAGGDGRSLANGEGQPSVNGDGRFPANGSGRQAAPAAVPGYTFADYCHEERAWRQAQDWDGLLDPWRGLAGGPVSRSPLPRRADPDRAAETGQLVVWVEADLADGI